MKKLIFVFIGFLLISALGLLFLVRFQKKPLKKVAGDEEASVQLIGKLPESERPIVSLVAQPDGKELTLTIKNLKNINVVEYELLYLTEGMSRGVIGSITINGEESIKRNLLLGTCSHGVCRYDKDVSGGTLTLTFRSKKTYKFIKDFKLKKENGIVVVAME